MQENKEFENFWKLVQESLVPKQTIQNWSNANGYLGNEFAIHSIDSNGITVLTIEENRERHIEKSEFQQIFQLWDEYCKGNIKRYELRNININTTYIISIIHFVENKGNEK